MKSFPWRAGMLAIACDGIGVRRVLWVGGGLLGFCGLREPAAGYRPDPDDGATKGALLEAVREAFEAPAVQVTPYVRWDPVARRTVIDEWMVCLNDADDRSFRGHSSEFAALMAAWQAAP